MKGRSKEVTSRIMSSIKSKNTKPELLLRKSLWKLGVRYRIHSNILGKPDLCIKKYKIAIFIDGDYWHGNNWRIRGLKNLDEELKTYSQFWKNKILNNIERDKYVSSELERNGWKVIRIWESLIIIDVVQYANKIKIEIDKRKREFA